MRCQILSSPRITVRYAFSHHASHTTCLLRRPRSTSAVPSVEDNSNTTTKDDAHDATSSDATHISRPPRTYAPLSSPLPTPSSPDPATGKEYRPLAVLASEPFHTDEVQPMRSPTDTEPPHVAQQLRQEDKMSQDAGQKLQLIWELLEHSSADKRAMPTSISDVDMELGELVQTLTKPSSRGQPFVRPRTWTRANFTTYVSHLVFSVDPDTVRPDSKTGSIPYVHAVSKELTSLFTDKLLASWIDNDSLHHCLAFLDRYRKFEFAANVRDFWNLGSVEKEREHYDKCLEIAASGGSVVDFISNLQEMVRKHVQPNGQTWAFAYLLTSKISLAFAQRLWMVMSETGRLQHHREMLEQVVCVNLESDMAEFRGRGLDLEQSLQALDRRYGLNRAWLTNSAMNELVRIVLRHERKEESGLTMDAGRKMEKFLLLATRRDDMETVVLYLRILGEGCRNEAPPDHAVSWSSESRVSPTLKWRTIVWPLFRIAWDGVYANCLRVIWRYACMAGIANDRRMQQTMRTGRAAIRRSDDTSTAQKRQRASLFAHDLALEGRKGEPSSPPPTAEIHEQSAHANYVPSPPAAETLQDQRHQRMSMEYTPSFRRLRPVSPSNKHHSDRAYNAAIPLDTSYRPMLRPTRDIIEILQEALELDRQWAASKHMMSLKEMEQNGISVPVVLR